MQRDVFRFPLFAFGRFQITTFPRVSASNVLDATFQIAVKKNGALRTTIIFDRFG